jgi:hypothetical protein
MRQTKRRNANTNIKTNTKTPAAPEPADDDPVPENIDEFRNELARRINRFVAEQQQYWRGCKERACRRSRACCAPHIRCSNAPPLPPDPDGQRLARTLAQIQRALREVAARRGEAE